jgi:hypothetical protein
MYLWEERIDEVESFEEYIARGSARCVRRNICERRGRFLYRRRQRLFFLLWTGRGFRTALFFKSQ